MLSELDRRGPFRVGISVPRRRGRLHVMPTSLGLEEAHGGYSFDGRRRGPLPFAVLQHTISGSGRLRYERRLYKIEPGQTMLVTVPHSHRYWVEAGDHWRFFWIGFTGQEALRLIYALQAAAGPVLTLTPATVDRLADFCLQLGQHRADETTVGSLSAIAYSALMALFDDVPARHHGQRLRAGSPDIGRVITHLRANLDQPLNVDDLATVAGLSRAHFSRLFTAEAGLAPATFLAEERMRLAERLLPNQALSIKQVSSACGYADPNYFAKAFRSRFGRTPSAYRALTGTES